MVEETPKKTRKPYKRNQTVKFKPTEEKSDLSLTVDEPQSDNKQVDNNETESKKSKKIESKKVSIRSKRARFYSIGRKFTKTPTILDVDSLEDGELDILKGEYWLVVTEV